MALDDVSLTVGEGEIVALVGESGSGKSTLGRAVVGLERLDEGKALFDGVEYACMSERSLRKLRPQMHLVLQDPYQSLDRRQTVRQCLVEAVRVHLARPERSVFVREDAPPSASVMVWSGRG